MPQFDPVDKALKETQIELNETPSDLELAHVLAEESAEQVLSPTGSDGIGKLPWKRPSKAAWSPESLNNPAAYAGFWRRFLAHWVDWCIVNSITTGLFALFFLTEHILHPAYPFNPAILVSIWLTVGAFTVIPVMEIGCALLLPSISDFLCEWGDANAAKSQNDWMETHGGWVPDGPVHYPDAFPILAPAVLFILTPFLVDATYRALMESSQYQATIGKILFRIHVSDLKGRRLRLLQAFARYFSKILSSISLCAGYIAICWLKRKQGFHDIIARTYVLKDVPSVTVPAVEGSSLFTLPRSFAMGWVILCIGIIFVVSLPWSEEQEVRNAATIASNDKQERELLMNQAELVWDVCVTGKDHVWVDIDAVSTGESLFSGFLEQGDHRCYDDPKGVRVRTSNGGNVIVRSNGRTQTLGTFGVSVEKVFTTKQLLPKLKRRGPGRL